MLDQSLSDQNKNKDLIFRSLATKAGVQLSLHNFKEAYALGQKAIQLNPYNAGIYGVLVDANVELGNYEEAVKMADKMVSIRPDLRSYSRVSYLREIHGDIPGAIKALEMAIKAGYPGYEQTAWTRLTLGDLHLQYGEKEKAEFQYKAALVERPDYPFAIAGLAEIGLLDGNKEKADSLLNDACSIIPEVGFYVTKAKLLKASGQTAPLQKMIEEILLMLQDDEENGHRMSLEYAEVYAELLNDQDKALEYVLKEYKDRPENIDVNRHLAQIYFAKGETTLANKHFLKAQITNSKHPGLEEIRKELASR